MSGTAHQRLGWVDMAKGLSIVLVVMMHSTLGVGVATNEVGFMHYVLAFATPFRMPEFFVISGLFLSAVITRPWMRYADRRIVHYLYFYALWAVILILFKELLVARDPAFTAQMLVSALYDPYSVLWFIYALALFSLIAKLLWQARIPHWAVLVLAALLSALPIATPSTLVNYSAHYFVFFYAGYVGAPLIFKLGQGVAARPLAALAGLLVWGVANAALVFSPSHEVLPGEIVVGVADIPGLPLVLALVGAVAVCTTAVLLDRLQVMAWLRWIGAHSIVVYLSFVLPMGIFRTLLLAVVPGIDAGVASLLTLMVAVAAPIAAYLVVKTIGFGTFLFERPAWAHLPGAPGSRQDRAAAPAPAE